MTHMFASWTANMLHKRCWFASSQGHSQVLLHINCSYCKALLLCDSFFFYLCVSISVLTMLDGVVPAGPVCLAWPMGPPVGPICPGFAWLCPMPMPMPCPAAGGCCWGPVVAVVLGCPGLAADVWACCWSWVLCPGTPSVWEPRTPCRPDPVGPPAEPWARVELLPDLEEPGLGKRKWL